jgi:mannose-6-phosphate isomerase-like protein (cupin superfamily)
VVKRVFPNSSDFENLSHLRTEVAAVANEFDYSGVVVRKPWGYEYLWHQNAVVAVWVLHLNAGCATSMHCHARKRTSLIILSGAVLCSTFDNRYPLGAGQAVVLEPGVFHTTMAVSPGGACLMEVETPPMKGDLLRFRDNFGRVGQGYEGTKQYSTDFAEFDYAPLRSIKHGGAPFRFKDTQLQFQVLARGADSFSGLNHDGLVVPFQGQLAGERKLLADIGEAVPMQRVCTSRLVCASALELLHVAPVGPTTL